MITPQIIHDPRNDKRLSLLMDELHNQNINNAVIWEATIDLPTVEASINKSHKDIIRWAKERDLEEVCIFEDDLMFQDQYSWKYFLDNKPTNGFDLYMGGAYGIGKFEQGAYGVDAVRQESETLLRIRSFQGLHCYICHKNFYDIFLSMPNDEHIDVTLADHGEYYVCMPMIAYQRPGFSATAKREVNYNQ
jgi:hypothetical protein